MTHLTGRIAPVLASPARTSAAVLALAAGIFAVAGTGSAYAYFAGGHGSGNGAVTPGALKTITASGATLSGSLYPGSTADLVVTLANPYPASALTVTGVTAGTDPITVTGGSGCTAGNAAVGVTPPASITPSSVPAGSTGTQITLLGAVKMDAGAANGCQSATFTVPLEITVKVG